MIPRRHVRRARDHFERSRAGGRCLRLDPTVRVPSTLEAAVRDRRLRLEESYSVRWRETPRAAGVSKYFTHNCGGVSANQAIGRHIFQDNRTRGNNCTLADCYSGDNQATNCNPASVANEDGRNLELEVLRPKIVASSAKKRASGDANIGFDRHLRQTENSNIVPNPDVIADCQAPGVRDIYVTAKAKPPSNFRTERAQQGGAKARSPGTGILEEKTAHQHP